MRFTILIILVALSQAEYFNFDYTHHGADWETQAPSTQNWEACSSSTFPIISEQQQSPVSLSNTLALRNESLLFANFYNQKALIFWYNTTVYIRSNPISNSFGQLYTKITNGLTPSMRSTQIRIRSHSEHQINGKYYDLELQVFCAELFSSPNNLKLAVSLMFEVGDQEDPALQAIIDSYVPGNQTVPFPSVNATLSLGHLLNNNAPFDFWFYQGSTTIPPCYSGKLSWVVANKVFSMSQKQRDFFWGMFNNEAMDGNWRELQPLESQDWGFYKLGE